MKRVRGLLGRVIRLGGAAVFLAAVFAWTSAQVPTTEPSVASIPRDEIGHRDGASMLLPAPSQRPLSSIEMDPTEVNLGPVVSGETANAVVTVQNRTSKAITLGTRTRCGCVEARFLLAGGQLSGHASCSMAVSFRLENRAGPVEESVRVLVDGNDAGGVVVHATVIGGIEIASERAGEDVVAQGDVRDVSLSLVGSSDLGPWKPVGVSVGPDDAPTQTLDVPFTFELRSVVDDPARRYSVRLQIPGVSTIGRRRVRVRVRTDGVRPLEPRAIIGFDVVPVVRSTTSILYLGVISDGAPRPARVRFLSANRRYPFNLRGARVIDVESPDAESDYLAIVDRDEIGYYADVTWKGRDRTPRALKATLVVETNRSECPSIQVALVGTVPIPSAPAPQSTSPAR